MATQASAAHRWRFVRLGGVDQVLLESGADILALDTLDQKLWVALSCPVKGLQFDERTLQLLDVDGDGRVRAPEILAAVRWLGLVLKDANDLVAGQDGVRLAALRDDTPEGRSILASARHILAGLGKPDAELITVTDTLATAEVFAQGRLNGDGVVPPSSVPDGALRGVAEAVVACTGGVLDRSGAQGYDAATLTAFFAACEAFDGWMRSAEADARTILPLGDGTQSAFAAVEAVRAKVDEFFARCRLASFDERALASLQREEVLVLDAAAKDLSISLDEVRAFPLASTAAGGELPLTDGVNPAWTSAVAALRDAAVKPLLGADRASLGEDDWRALCERLQAYAAWTAARQGESVQALGIGRVREILAGDARASLAALIADDLRLADAVNAITSVEKAARLHRDLFRLLNNFVNFSDFYARRKAVFQAGTLYLDARSCDFCVAVLDAAKHATLAPMSRAYLAYLDCRRPSGETLQIAAAFTAGDSDNLFVGRNGLFYDRQGRDWDATITRIVDNPISIGQAFFSPYKKLLRWIEEQVAKRAAADEAGATAKLQASAGQVGGAATTGVVQPPKKMDIGVLAAISVAIGGITTVLGGIMQAFFGLGYLMPLGMLGLVLLISGPSMVIAWLKLRQRNLGPILDANGWAVNALTRINLPLGRSLTSVSEIPAGATRTMKDPFAPRRSPWPRVLLVLLVLAGVGYGLHRANYLHTWFPDVFPRQAVASIDGPSTAKAGETIEIVVGDLITSLTVHASSDGSVQTLTAAEGRIPFTVPADAAPGTRYTFSDPARPSSSCTVDVVE